MHNVRILIDGHNLIPHIPGLSLGTLDDETALIELLQVYTRHSRHKVEIFFDAAPPGHAGARAYGMVTAHFVSARTIADAAIRVRLKALGSEARQVMVVSSDRQVQAEARASGAQIRACEQFARELLSAPAAGTSASKRKHGAKPAPEAPLPADQVQDWLDLFKKDKTNSD
jgi:hypothetical protein